MRVVRRADGYYCQFGISPKRTEAHEFQNRIADTEDVKGRSSELYPLGSHYPPGMLWQYIYEQALLHAKLI
ncbi:MAG: hypothetical protein AB4426_34730 [Xenococcaceae cyanobacterium]